MTNYNKYSYLEQRPRKKAVVDSKKYCMENFDYDVCDLLSVQTFGLPVIFPPQHQ